MKAVCEGLKKIMEGLVEKKWNGSEIFHSLSHNYVLVFYLLVPNVVRILMTFNSVVCTA